MDGQGNIHDVPTLISHDGVAAGTMATLREAQSRNSAVEIFQTGRRVSLILGIHETYYPCISVGSSTFDYPNKYLNDGS
jgi:hypothetical protein